MSHPTCPTCGGEMQTFSDAKGKPYAQCKPCGAQFFVRSKVGVERFTAKYGTPQQKGKPAAAPAPSATPAAPAAAPTRRTSEAPAGDEKKGFDLYDY